MFFKSCDKPEESRTDGYVFSVISKDDPGLVALRAEVKRHNKTSRKLLREYWESRGKMPDVCDGCYSIQRVSIMARGARAKWAKKDGLYPRSYDSSLPHKYAEYFDVYRNIDSYAMYNFRREQSEGFSLHQLKKLDDAAYAISNVRWEQVHKLMKAELFESQWDALQYLKEK